MALNKKLIILSGVGLVVTGAAAGVIGYKASQVANGQDQMDDSNASMGGQLSFGLASPLAGFAADAGTEFMTNIQDQIKADAAKGHISYVNLSDQLQGDLITGAAHTANLVDQTKPTNTNVGDAQFALNQILTGAVAQADAAAAAAKTLPANTLNAMYSSDDFEIPNLKAADIRRMINEELTDKRIIELFSNMQQKAALATATAKKDKVEVQKISSEVLTAGKASMKNIVKKLKTATVISLNAGLEDIIEAASGGVTFTELVANQFNPTKQDDMTLGKMMGNLLKDKKATLKSAIDSVGNLNGALSAIRRLNPNAKIALGQLGTYGVDAIDDSLKQINLAIQVDALTQDIKSGDVTVAPMDPVAKQFVTNPATPDVKLSLQDMYTLNDANHAAVAAQFQGVVAAMMKAAAGK